MDRFIDVNMEVGNEPFDLDLRHVKVRRRRIVLSFDIFDEDELPRTHHDWHTKVNQMLKPFTEDLPKTNDVGGTARSTRKETVRIRKG